MIRFHDMFCGAGGSSLGAWMAGAVPVVGLNHWLPACTSYEANHAAAGGRAAHVDVVTQDPRRYPPADMLLASPECTHHSYARGRPKDDASLFDPVGDQGAERSRATMWDVVRFAEVHAYRLVIVENVEAAVKWGLPRGRKLAHGSYGPLFAAWLSAMVALGYRYELVHLNSMVCGVPQSRDRLYVVFWQRGQRRPDLDITALGWCPHCDRLVDAQQRWKRPGATVGTYGQQYVYVCPGCGTVCALAVRPAASAIDWELASQRIGDRARPLKPATLERIRRGLLRLRERPASVRLPDGLVVQVGGNLFERAGYARAWATDGVMPTVTTTADRALVMPTTHDDSSQRTRVAGEEPLPTITAANRGEQAVVVSNMAHNVPSRAQDEPAGSVTTGNKLAIVVTQRGTNVPTRQDEPIDTVSAQGTHHGLVIANYGSPGARKGKDGWARHADDGPLGTVTATDSHALFTYRDDTARRMEEPAVTVTTIQQHALLGDVTQEEIEACTFRMLQPAELKVASGFTAEYILHGTKTDQVALVGNAVTAPAEAELVRRVIASLEPA